jgi:Heterokaryon incompatibility protein (HET)
MDNSPVDPGNNEIRILKVESASRMSEPIRCRLEHTSLNDLPPYTALSYCWGSASDCRTIYVDRHSVQIRANLYYALRQLRSEDTRELWVDALCINQDDNAEKNSQIYLMRNIYYRAQEVIAWVGLDGREDGPLIASLQEGTALETEFFDQLNRFLRREYWRRAWIIQEIAFARQLTVRCSSHSLKWSQLKSGVLRMKLPEDLERTQVDTYEYPVGLLRTRRETSEVDTPTAKSLLTMIF